MATCEVSGNDYDKAFEAIVAGQRHVSDSFEYAIDTIAPVCEHCGCMVIGHSIQIDGRWYCCAHCARETAHTSEARDRVETAR
jgi:Rieske Fe-S protein